MSDCNGGGAIDKMYLIEWSDIKSFEPFELKRKYGKFKREIHVIKVEDKSNKEYTRNGTIDLNN